MAYYIQNKQKLSKNRLIVTKADKDNTLVIMSWMSI